MEKRSKIALSFAIVGGVGALVSLTFIPLRTETAKVQVRSVTLDYDKKEYICLVNYNLDTQEPMNETFVVKDIKLGSSRGVATLYSHYDIWGNFKYKSLKDVYYSGTIYLK